VEARLVADEQSGFLGRWARRKTDVLQGKVVQEPVVVTKPVLPEPVASEVKPGPEQATEKPPALSLDDVKLLTKDSDFKPFMAQNVGSDVRNAAMKKLFADPHFNVMDGLDIYIDDYSKSDPIPEAMLRAMTSSKFLKLFDEEEDLDKNGDAALPRENANNPTDQTVAQSDEHTDIAEPDSAPQINSSQPELLPDGINSVASQKDHDDPHLRLQPDHAAPAPKAGHGT
jgi:Protein of unknown function (DUF3306)